jgi:hypothetical protein
MNKPRRQRPERDTLQTTATPLIFLDLPNGLIKILQNLWKHVETLERLVDQASVKLHCLQK